MPFRQKYRKDEVQKTDIEDDDPPKAPPKIPSRSSFRELGRVLTLPKEEIDQPTSHVSPASGTRLAFDMNYQVPIVAAWRSIKVSPEKGFMESVFLSVDIRVSLAQLKSEILNALKEQSLVAQLRSSTPVCEYLEIVWCNDSRSPSFPKKTCITDKNIRAILLFLRNSRYETINAQFGSQVWQLDRMGSPPERLEKYSLVAESLKGFPDVPGSARKLTDVLENPELAKALESPKPLRILPKKSSRNLVEASRKADASASPDGRQDG